MAHTHREEQTAWYLDQFCTLAISASLGAIGILLWWRGDLAGILTDNFQQAVLVGSIALLLVVLLRAVVLWLSTGDLQPCHHHDHAPPPALPRQQDHSHGWNPARYTVLLLPIALFFLGLPGKEVHDYYLRYLKGQSERPANVGMVAMATRGDEIINLDFRDLVRAAHSQKSREHYEGRLATVFGMQVADGDNSRLCTLRRLWRTCCLADVVELKATVVSLEPLPPPLADPQWVSITGQIQFRPREGRKGAYVTVLQLRSAKDVMRADPPRNPYLE